MLPPLRVAAFVLAWMIHAGPGGAAPLVATDIPPVHSIVARVMAGVGEPQVIVPPGASPHGHAMRPSSAGLLAEADAVVWVGPELTPWLAGPIAALADRAHVLELLAADGLYRLPLRRGARFEAHDHQGGDHAHDQSGVDAHVWLDPRNGVAMATAVAGLLGRIDPENAAAYSANARDFAAEMAALETEIAETVVPLGGRPYVVFHDAYQYFEVRFGLPAAGSVTLGDAHQPSAARVGEIRERVRDEEVVCVFAEPQFEPRLVATVTEGTDARTGTLDPEGAGMAPGPELYPRLLRGLAEGLAACLGD